MTDHVEPTNDEPMVLVPVPLIEAVAHVGIDFGHGKFELDASHIAAAREIFDDYQASQAGAA